MGLEQQTTEATGQDAAPPALLEDPPAAAAMPVAPEAATEAPEVQPPRLVPPPAPEAAEQAQAEEEPPRARSAAQPAAEEEPPRAAKRQAAAKPQTKTEEKEGAAGTASIDQVRRYRRRWNAAETAEEKAEALAYGVERGVPEAVELDRLLRTKAAPVAQQVPASAAPQQPQPTAKPVTESAQAGAAPAAQSSTPPPPPAAEPMIMGQPATAVRAQAEKAKFIADILGGVGKLAGWEGEPSEPMTLFEGLPGVQSFEVKGQPKKQLVELLAVELAADVGKVGGNKETPFARRLQIGLLAATVAGPGLLPLGMRIIGGAFDKFRAFSSTAAGVARRFRRK